MYANTANMQLAENAQIGNNLYNMYSVSSNEYENAYAKDWQNWQQSIDSAYKLAGMQSSDYWNNETMEFQKAESRREQSNWEKSYALDLASAGAKKDNNGNIVVDNKKPVSLTSTELEKVKEVWAQSGGDLEQVDAYLTTIGKNDMDDDANAALISQLKSSPAYQDWTISDDTINGGWFFGTNWFGGKKTEDHNDVYSNGTTTMTYDQLKEAINNSDMPEEQKKAKLDALRKQSKR
jgi:hypothetical protein